ncbi:Hypothetical protein BN2458_PEG1481 [Helicobacter typhlonius]|uniref:Uncharacterized protein n=1 Tax=Helicobacter typhlonius TaxID=76936 RepID=A0A0S4PWI0_9HELI|nr:Hypothetical protein BN2458_PEG1481 [Helicobacter typhlonius]
MDLYSLTQTLFFFLLFFALINILYLHLKHIALQMPLLA